MSAETTTEVRSRLARELSEKSPDTFIPCSRDEVKTAARYVSDVQSMNAESNITQLVRVTCTDHFEYTPKPFSAVNGYFAERLSDTAPFILQIKGSRTPMSLVTEKHLATVGDPKIVGDILHDSTAEIMSVRTAYGLLGASGNNNVPKTYDRPLEWVMPMSGDDDPESGRKSRRCKQFWLKRRTEDGLVERISQCPTCQTVTSHKSRCDSLLCDNVLCSQKADEKRARAMADRVHMVSDCLGVDFATMHVVVSFPQEQSSAWITNERSYRQMLVALKSVMENLFGAIGWSVVTHPWRGRKDRKTLSEVSEYEPRGEIASMGVSDPTATEHYWREGAHFHVCALVVKPRHIATYKRACERLYELTGILVKFMTDWENGHEVIRDYTANVERLLAYQLSHCGIPHVKGSSVRNSTALRLYGVFNSKHSLNAVDVGVVRGACKCPTCRTKMLAYGTDFEDVSARKLRVYVSKFNEDGAETEQYRQLQEVVGAAPIVPVPSEDGLIRGYNRLIGRDLFERICSIEGVYVPKRDRDRAEDIVTADECDHMRLRDFELRPVAVYEVGLLLDIQRERERLRRQLLEQKDE